MPSFAAPTGPVGGAPDASTEDPAQAQQMQEMREQMAAMQAQLQQQAASPPNVQQPLSGYRRPGGTPAPSTNEPASHPGAELSGGARPSIEGSPYEAVLPEEQAGRSEAKAATPEAAAPSDPAPVPPAADGGAFRQQPQRLVSSGDTPPPGAEEEEDHGEVDRVMLAKEFSGLLQEGEDGDED